MLGEVKRLIIAYDVDAASCAAKDAIVKGVDPLKVLEAASEAIKTVGEKFHRLEMFLPQLIMAGETMLAVEKVIERNLPKGTKLRTKHKITLGTVIGDLHDIGKNIVFAMLTGAGFEVTDLGKDVPIERFIEKAKESDARIIAASALMTTTIDGQRQIVDELKRLGVRDQFKVMIGGGSTTQEWATQIGADGYGKDARDAVETALMLVGQ